mgnify:CR=1 FL=1
MRRPLVSVTDGIHRPSGTVVREWHRLARSAKRTLLGSAQPGVRVARVHLHGSGDRVVRGQVLIPSALVVEVVNRHQRPEEVAVDIGIEEVGEGA